MSTRVAIVTGGSQGIGLATASALAARGMRVAVIARDRQRLGEVAASIGTDGVIGIPADVRNEADVSAAVAQVVERFGRVDVLVNSAGVSMSARRRLEDTTSEEWRRIIETNLTGTYLMCREALPHLRKSPCAHILNVQSTAAFRSNPGVSLYAASKFGVRALTEALIEECRGSNVRVTSVSPGPVNTAIWSHKLEPPSEEERARMLLPADIAEIFLWLLERPARLHIPDITVTPWATS